jgi:hypothetical protein
MLLPDKIIEELEDYASFVASLHKYSDTELITARVNSQWSICDVVSHIMKWDENFTQTVLTKIVNGEPAVLEEHADVQTFNQQAVEYGRTLPPKTLLEEAAKHRYRLVSLLRLIPHVEFSNAFSSRSSHTLSGFLYEMFVLHDAHHRRQIEQYLAIKQTEK